MKSEWSAERNKMVDRYHSCTKNINYSLMINLERNELCLKLHQKLNRICKWIKCCHKILIDKRNAACMNMNHTRHLKCYSTFTMWQLSITTTSLRWDSLQIELQHHDLIWLRPNAVAIYLDFRIWNLNLKSLMNHDLIKYISETGQIETVRSSIGTRLVLFRRPDTLNKVPQIGLKRLRGENISPP